MVDAPSANPVFLHSKALACSVDPNICARQKNDKLKEERTKVDAPELPW
jgi:hypothetical protein